MIMERTKNAGRNIVFGIIQKIYAIIMPFVIRTAMIHVMGVQYLGVNGVFTSILSVLNLAELGVGSAISYSLYKPIAEDDTRKIRALMALYKKYYRIIGIVILVAGMAIVPVLPNMIKMDTVPQDVDIYILYFLNLGATVLSYWLFAYKNALIGAHQRGDICSKISIASSTITYMLQLLVVCLVKNLYVFSAVVLLVGIINNVITAIIADRMYPQYKPEGNLEKEEVRDINKKVRDLFTSKIGGVVYNSADTMVISAFLGMQVLAVYQNYFFVQQSIADVIQIVIMSCMAGIGNSLVVESKEKNYNDLNKFTFIINWISGFCMICLLNLFQPFMELWTGPDLMLDFRVVICIAIYFYVMRFNNLLNLYKDSGGMWREDRFRPLVCSLANLVVNLILVRYIGIYGVMLATVFSSVVIGMPWLLHNLFTVMFERRYLKGYVLKILKYVIVTVFMALLMQLICDKIVFTNLWITFFVRGIVCAVVVNGIYYLMYRKTVEFKQSVVILNKLTKGKLAGVLDKL